MFAGKSLLFTLAGILIVFFILLVGSFLNRKLADRKASAVQALTVDPLDLDIGEQWATNDFEWQVPFYNRSNETIVLKSLEGDCSCLTITGIPMRLDAGETSIATLKLDLTSRCKPTADFSPRPLSLGLRGIVSTSKQEHGVEWKLVGRIKPAFRTQTNGIDFGRLWNPSLPMKKTLNLVAAPGIGRIEVNPNTNPGNLRIACEKSAGSGSYALTVSLLELSHVGCHKGEIEITPVTTKGVRLSPSRLPVEWEVLSEIQADPPTLDLGAIPVGSEGGGGIILRSLANRPFIISRCNTSKPGASIATKTDLGVLGEAIPISVAIKSTFLGDQTSELVIEGVSLDKTRFQIRCSVRYYGLTPSRSAK